MGWQPEKFQRKAKVHTCDVRHHWVNIFLSVQLDIIDLIDHHFYLQDFFESKYIKVWWRTRLRILSLSWSLSYVWRSTLILKFNLNLYIPLCLCSWFSIGWGQSCLVVLAFQRENFWNIQKIWSEHHAGTLEFFTGWYLQCQNSFQNNSRIAL